MGPHQEESAERSSWQPGVQGAAALMGPRQKSAGKLANRGVQVQGYCFNGAASKGAGKAIVPRMRCLHLVLLQWGRGEEGAESSWPESFPVASRLQMVHVKARKDGPTLCLPVGSVGFNGAASKSAERSSTSISMEPITFASMGPHQKERGKHPPRPTTSPFESLQWGRVSKSAERSDAELPIVTHGHASMGPRQKSAEKSARTRQWKSRKCFNGAASEKAQEKEVAALYHIVGMRRLMGPRSERRGKRCLPDAGGMQEEASMGPQSEKARKATLSCRDAGSSSAEGEDRCRVVFQGPPYRRTDQDTTEW